MATWYLADELNHPLDFLLIQNGFISFVRRQAVLVEAISWLQNHSYKVLQVDSAAWQTPVDMHRDIARVLEFPAALFGHRMMCIVSTAEAGLEIPHVGTAVVSWNHREFRSTR